MRRDDSHGETERCQEGTGKGHMGEACDPKDVPGNLIRKNMKTLCGCRAFFLWRIVDVYAIMIFGLLCPNV